MANKRSPQEVVPRVDELEVTLEPPTSDFLGQVINPVLSPARHKSAATRGITEQPAESGLVGFGHSIHLENESRKPLVRRNTDVALVINGKGQAVLMSPLGYLAKAVGTSYTRAYRPLSPGGQLKGVDRCRGLKGLEGKGLDEIPS